jgi:16S rRNA processing protein RimM
VEPEALLALGRVTGAHGIRGLVKMSFYSGAAPQGIGPGSVVRLRSPAGEITHHTALEIAAHGGQFLLRLERVLDRGGAEALVGAELVVARGDLPELEEGSFYWSDLIGMEVLTGDGRRLGELVDILETGSNDVYRVRGRRGEVLVPALASVVRRVDLQARRMWVDLPEGL